MTRCPNCKKGYNSNTQKVCTDCGSRLAYVRGMPETDDTLYRWDGPFNHIPNIEILVCEDKTGLLEATCCGCGKRFSKPLEDAILTLRRYEHYYYKMEHPGLFTKVSEIFTDWTPSEIKLFATANVCEECAKREREIRDLYSNCVHLSSQFYTDPENGSLFEVGEFGPYVLKQDAHGRKRIKIDALPSSVQPVTGDVNRIWSYVPWG
jgi:hypothetical protein